MLKKLPKKEKNGGVSQAGQRENRRFFGFKQVEGVDKKDDTLTARRSRALV